MNLEDEVAKGRFACLALLKIQGTDVERDINLAGVAETLFRRFGRTPPEQIPGPALLLAIRANDVTQQ